MTDTQYVAALRDESRREHNDRIANESYVALRDELIEALYADPLREVATPEFLETKQSATQVVLDDIASKTWVLAELLRIAAQASRGENVAPKVSALFGSIAGRHAWFHSDLVKPPRASNVAEFSKATDAAAWRLL
jgi:hypothetical protein